MFVVLKNIFRFLTLYRVFYCIVGTIYLIVSSLMGSSYLNPLIFFLCLAEIIRAIFHIVTEKRRVKYCNSIETDEFPKNAIFVITSIFAIDPSMIFICNEPLTLCSLIQFLIELWCLMFSIGSYIYSIGVIFSYYLRASQSGFSIGNGIILVNMYAGLWTILYMITACLIMLILVEKIMKHCKKESQIEISESAVLRVQVSLEDI